MKKPQGPASPGRSRLLKILLAVFIFLIFLGTLLIVMMTANRVPDELREPPESNISATFAARRGNSGNQPAARPDRPQWNKPAPPKDFEEYLEFRRTNPGGAAAVELYHAVSERLKDPALFEGFQNAFLKRDANDRSIPWSGETPLSDEQKQWLAAHKDLIDLIHRMIRAGGPPVPSREELAGYNYATFNPPSLPDFMMLQRTALILRAEAQRLVEAGDFEAARALVEDIYSSSEALRDNFLIGSLFATAIQAIGNGQVSGWLRSGRPMPAEAAQALSRTLAEHRLGLADQRFVCEQEYRTLRAFGVTALSGSALDMINLIYKRNLHHRSVVDERNDLEIIKDGWRNPGTAVTSAWDAFRMRANAANSIRAYDEFWSEFSKGLDKPYEESPAAQRNMPPFANDPTNWFGMLIPDLSEVLVRTTVTEAGINLNRAGIELLLDIPAPPSDQDNSLPNDHAWRDPFTDKPLRTAPDADATLIYSLGPDMQDQQGRVQYDPTNGVLSEGDLILRLPR